MGTHRDTLAPQMANYDNFVDRGETRWLPYLMYFHRTNYRSPVVNTDSLGFRLAAWQHRMISPANVRERASQVKLLVGSSTVFGVGASNDTTTIASRLSTYDPESPWLNFGGRGYCSTQEFLLFLLHRHLLPEVREIVIMGGLNDLILTGLPEPLQSQYGGFFFCGDYYRQMDELRTHYQQEKRSWWHRRRTQPQQPQGAGATPQERVDAAAQQISRNLDNWLPFVARSGARLSFILQPLATWVREVPAPEERALFDELDARETEFWRQLFGATADRTVAERYAETLSEMCAKRDIRFCDMNTELSVAAQPDQWLFVDRAHFNDTGYELVSQIIANNVGLFESVGQARSR